MPASTMGRKRAMVLLLVHVVAIAHIVHWRMTGASLSPLEPSEAMEFSKHDVVNAGLLFFAAMILSTALFGRFFCGWGCHIVALQDLSSTLLKRIGLQPKPLRSRTLLWVPLVAFVYMFLWPVIYRLWIGDQFGPVENALVTADFWAAFPGWVLGLATFVICGFVVVYFLGHKGFCTYACPYGGIFGLADRIAPTKILVTDACAGCGHCTAVCTSNVRVHEEVRDYGKVIDPGCMKTLDCVAACPSDALFVGFSTPSLFSKPRVDHPASRKPQLRWRDELILVIAFAAAFFTFRGLYGLVPFLLSLGLSACLAYLVLTFVRLLRDDNLRLRRWTLKRGGQWQTAGHGFAMLMVLLAVFWAQSAAVRYSAVRGQGHFGATADFRDSVLDPAAVRPLTAAERQTVDNAIRHLDRSARWGLVTSHRATAQLAWLYRLQGDREAFMAHARRSVSKDVEVATMQTLIATQHVQDQRYAQAIEAYRLGLELDPQLALYLGLGTLLGQLGEIEQASTVTAAGLVAHPDSADLYYNQGLIRALSGNSASAIGSFEHALLIDPRHLQARENLAGMLAGLGRFEESLMHYEAASAQSPDDPVTLLLIARAQLALGDRSMAEASAQQALDLDPDSAEIRSFLASINITRPDS